MAFKLPKILRTKVRLRDFKRAAPFDVRRGGFRMRKPLPLTQVFGSLDDLGFKLHQGNVEIRELISDYILHLQKSTHGVTGQFAPKSKALVGPPDKYNFVKWALENRKDSKALSALKTFAATNREEAANFLKSVDDIAKSQFTSSVKAPARTQVPLDEVVTPEVPSYRPRSVDEGLARINRKGELVDTKAAKPRTPEEMQQRALESDLFDPEALTRKRIVKPDPETIRPGNIKAEMLALQLKKDISKARTNLEVTDSERAQDILNIAKTYEEQMGPILLTARKQRRLPEGELLSPEDAKIYNDPQFKNLKSIQKESTGFINHVVRELSYLGDAGVAAINTLRQETPNLMVNMIEQVKVHATKNWEAYEKLKKALGEGGFARTGKESSSLRAQKAAVGIGYRPLSRVQGELSIPLSDPENLFGELEILDRITPGELFYASQATRAIGAGGAVTAQDLKWAKHNARMFKRGESMYAWDPQPFTEPRDYVSRYPEDLWPHVPRHELPPKEILDEYGLPGEPGEAPTYYRKQKGSQYNVPPLGELGSYGSEADRLVDELVGEESMKAIRGGGEEIVPASQRQFVKQLDRERSRFAGMNARQKADLAELNQFVRDKKFQNMMKELNIGEGYQMPRVAPPTQEDEVLSMLGLSQEPKVLGTQWKPAIDRGKWFDPRFYNDNPAVPQVWKEFMNRAIQFSRNYGLTIDKTMAMINAFG